MTAIKNPASRDFTLSEVFFPASDRSSSELEAEFGGTEFVPDDFM